MKVSLCITTYNEEKYIDILLRSILLQKRQPDEVVIVDGGSTDKTLSRITYYASKNKNIKVISKRGNRPLGRNTSIQKASGDIIAITDAGCELDPDWLTELVKPFQNPKVDVVSGYYAGRPKTALEEALVPYVLVMPDKVNPLLFLPSTRSMAMRKQVWEKVGGFPQEYRWNEDYVFSKAIQKRGFSIVFSQKALVYWFPRESFLSGWKMFYAFAKGDMQAGIWRIKAVFLVARVIIGIIFLITAILFSLLVLLIFFGILFCCYWIWAINKNKAYMHTFQATLYLPIWQMVSDSAVFIGTIAGFFDRMKHQVFSQK